ncbi:hypothetical protein [Streptomyces sp. NPDC094468]|uniref:hypothetical protein n=1 Tax=Streptomyces sp. NPDC094468 TaxID=3366066 RepID=UPI00381AE164
MSTPTRRGFSGLIKRGPMAADVIGRDFTMVFNAAVRDRRLSRRARGLLVEILSHRDGFGVSEAALVAGGPEGRDAIRKALRELEECGYLHRHQPRDGGKFGEVVFEVTDMPAGLQIGAAAPWEASEEASEETRRSEPSPENPPTVDGVQKPRSEPSPEKPSTAKPSTANPPHKKTNSSCGAEDHLSPGRHTATAPSGTDTGERDAAAPEEPAAEPVADSAGSDNADVIVAAYAAAFGRPLLNGRRQRLREQALELLTAGLPVGWVADRAREMAARPDWQDLVQHADVSRVPVPGQRPATATGTGPQMCRKPGHGGGAFPADDCPACAAQSRPRREGPSRVDTAALIGLLRGGQPADPDAS